MNLYAVELTLHLGEYEKSALNWVSAESPQDAEYQALCDETHNEPLSRESYAGGSEWWDDDMLYRVYS